MVLKLKINIIGRVENKINISDKFQAENVVSRIIIDNKYNEALDGIEEFSHLMIIFWLDRVKDEDRRVLKVHPKGNPSNPLTGVFATHSPLRPNPVGVTVVQLLKRDKNIITVKGLDAINGTPILDIKCYIPIKDIDRSAKVPDWVCTR
jgi:tRNA-Thr(GGU) m(6)t(6)A37 methyltransferase TsaA